MPTTIPTFNGYALPGTIQELQRPVTARLRTADPAGYDGSYSQGGLLAAKRITIRAIVNCGSESARETQIADLRRYLPVGLTGSLVIESGRAYSAEVESLVETITPGSFRLEYEVVFFVPSGVAKGTVLNSFGLGSAGGTVLGTGIGGDHKIPPQIQIVVNSGANGTNTVTITNTTRNESMTLAPAANGTLILDTETEDVTRGGLSVIGEWIAGQWIFLSPHIDNVFTVTASGISLGLHLVTWYTRYK